MFYSESFQSPISTSSVKRLYGVNPDTEPARALAIGILPLIEAPAGYSPTHYVKEGSTYRAIPHEFSNEERESVRRIQAIGIGVREFVSDCIPDWDPATDYFAGTYVEHNGSLWQAISASTDVEPAAPEDPDETNEDWRFVR